MVSVEFDPKVNAMYLKLGKGNVAESEPLADNVILDLDEMGRIVGIEVLLPKLDERQIRLISTLSLPSRQGLLQKIKQLVGGSI